MAVRTGTDAEPDSAATEQAPMEVDLGARIRALRLARGETLRQLAAQAGVTESFLSQVERGVASPSIASVRRIVYQGLGAIDEFLTRATDGRLQVILSTIQPGGGTGDEAYTHDSDEEVVVVLEGVLDLWVGPEHYRLETGDALTHPSRVPHRNTNPGPGVARVLFCITPPSY